MTGDFPKVGIKNPPSQMKSVSNGRRCWKLGATTHSPKKFSNRIIVGPQLSPTMNASKACASASTSFQIVPSYVIRGDRDRPCPEKDAYRTSKLLQLPFTPQGISNYIIISWGSEVHKVVLYPNEYSALIFPLMSAFFERGSWLIHPSTLN